MSASKSGTTQLLLKLNNEGDKEIYDKLYPRVYDELKRMAYSKMQQQANHTLSKTELVHEAYLKMINQEEVDYNDRSHFLAVASKCMRQILIDYARKKKAQKRGGKQTDLTFIDELFRTQQEKIDELINIDAALDRLAELNQRLSDVVELRFFGEMTIENTRNCSIRNS